MYLMYDFKCSYLFIFMNVWLITYLPIIHFVIDFGNFEFLSILKKYYRYSSVTKLSIVREFDSSGLQNNLALFLFLL